MILQKRICASFHPKYKVKFYFCYTIVYMVRIINGKNVKSLANITYKILRIQEKFTHIEEFNNPGISPCIYALWHSNQFLVHGIRNRDKLSVLISTSIDGEIVAEVCKNWGFRVVRGSSGKKGAVESTMQMLARLKEGECVAIMVDGPHGPLHKVKNGAVKLAQMSKAPIIPVHWFSPQKTFITLPSWDKMKTPLGKCNILNIYGEPIYVSENATEEELANVKENIRNQLFDIEKKSLEYYNEALKQKLWKKK